MLIGDSSVGKTCIAGHYDSSKFNNSTIMTIGIDFKIKFVEINNDTLFQQIWDTPGEDRYKKITQSYLGNINVIIIVYDVTDSESFKNVGCWLDLINEFRLNYVRDYGEDINGVILAGNKIDMGLRKITYAEGLEYAKKYGMSYFECSAKDGTNIKEIFDEATKMYMKHAC